MGADSGQAAFALWLLSRRDDGSSAEATGHETFVWIQDWEKYKRKILSRMIKIYMMLRYFMWDQHMIDIW